MASQTSQAKTYHTTRRVRTLPPVGLRAALPTVSHSPIFHRACRRTAAGDSFFRSYPTVRSDTGDGDGEKPALRGLQTRSLGTLGAQTQPPGSPGTLASTLRGDVGAFETGAISNVALHIEGDLGSLKARNDFLASVLTVRGELSPSESSAALTVDHVKIGGDLINSKILIGYDASGIGVNSAVGVGRIRVAGNWMASDLAVGVSAGIDGLFGTDDDVVIENASPVSRHAKIAAVVIAGRVLGTAANDDGFGIVAQEIDSVLANGRFLPLRQGPENDRDGMTLGTTGDLVVREVAGLT